MELGSKNILNYLTGLGLIFWYIGVRLEKYSHSLLNLDWFYDIMDLDLKNTWTNLLDSDWFCYKHTRMLLENYENLLELSDKQLAIQSNLVSTISLGQTMFDVWKTKC